MRRGRPEGDGAPTYAGSVALSDVAGRPPSLTTGPRHAAAARTQVLRPDIQGLRAVAVLGVVLWHAGLPILSGGYVGVDVFFVISGFLMTSLLVRELDRDGRISIGAFYARRARRLLPAAAVALVGVLVVTVTMLPVNRWRGIGSDIVASAFYVVNWRLASSSVDYLAEGDAASPVQHFWSLSVEEQFYAFWPVLFAVTGWLVLRRAGARWLRPALLLVLAAMTVTSYAWSVIYTRSHPEQAYFVTTTRLWELGLGGLVAVLGTWLLRRKPGRPVANAIVALGLLAILGSGVVFDSSTAVPGSLALLPTLGTALVLALGPFCGGRAGPVRLLAAAPMQWIGGLSYSLYLWHWPLLVGAAARTPDGSLSVPLGLAVVGASLAPAWLSLRLIEDPLRRSRSTGRPAVVRALRLGTTCTVLSLIAGCSLVGYVAREGYRTDQLVGGAPGAQALGDAPSRRAVTVNRADVLVPSPALAGDDVFHPWYNGPCQPAASSGTPKTCVFGAVDSDVRVVVVGDSHAVMWLPALAEVAAARGWRLEVLAKPDCPLADTVVLRGHSANEPCVRWNDAVLASLQASPPDLVITAQVNVYLLQGPGGTVLSGADASTEFGAALARTWTRVGATGTPVLSLLDGPRFARSPVECVADHQRELDVCAGARAKVLEGNNTAQLAALALTPAVRVLDLTRWLCPGDTCPAVIGNTLVYSDTNHLGATYARSLTPYLAHALAGVGPRR